jgi:biopolymer transport protein ExbD
MRKRRTDEPFQMAPMIDMVFLLLVFFMTVSTIARDSRPEIKLARSTTARVPEATLPRAVLTLVGQGDDVTRFWHNRPVDEAELGRLLEALAGEGGESELLLRGPADLPWSVWQPVVALCREAGVHAMVFATHEA